MYQTIPKATNATTHSEADYEEVRRATEQVMDYPDSWLTTPHPQLGGRAPKDWITAGHKQLVLDLIGQIRDGTFS